MAIGKASREVRRKSQAEGAQRLIESGMLDDLFAKIDAGEVQLDGDGGFIQQLIKTGLERGLQAELTEHVGYEKGDPEASLHVNSRNGSFPKTVGTTAGEVELRIPRDRNGTFTPRLVPTGRSSPDPEPFQAAAHELPKPNRVTQPANICNFKTAGHTG